MADAAERAKAARDAMLHGTGWMRDGKHVPLNEVMIDKAERMAAEIFPFDAFVAQGITLSGDGLRTAIAAAIREAVEGERERCAKVADGFTCGACGMDGKAAAAIRALTGTETAGDA
ncbi:MAG TPA: hypothetical protein VM487_26375 [Phycisphaerae bacterium]|nr:hypothetical protein [Phycisphaerae bacterium]